jgi:hypothetical protein
MHLNREELICNNSDFNTVAAILTTAYFDHADLSDNNLNNVETYINIYDQMLARLINLKADK